MNPIRFAFSIALFACVIFCVARNVDAEEEVQPQAREFEQKEIANAEALRNTLNPELLLLFNGLRHLMRPAYEADLMEGRRFRACTLPPYEEPQDGPMTLLEILRFWAVIESGMPVTKSSDIQLSRFIDTPLPQSTDKLAAYAVQMAVCASCFDRGELGRGDDLRIKAESILEAQRKLKNATSVDSTLISGDHIAPLWFANHMWRALIYRCAVDLAIEFDEHDWEDDIRAMNASFVRKRGFPSSKKSDQPNISRDMHTNLMAIATLGLALTAPEDTLGGGVTRQIEKRIKEVPEILSRIETEYEDQRLTGSRLAVILSFAPQFAPERLTGAAWRDNVTRQGTANNSSSGNIHSRHSLASDLGLEEASWSRYDNGVAETALGCIAVCGGLLPDGKGLLTGVGLEDVGRTMYALSVLHASSARVSTGDMTELTEMAIEDGCRYLADIQTDDGSFPGQYAHSPGNTAMALLAMLHGGYDRESPEIQDGISWLINKADWGYRSTYAGAVALMFFQKYYEPAQKEHRILWTDDPSEFESAAREVWKDIEKSHARLIEKLVDEIQGAHVGGTQGGWGYGPNANEWGGRTHSDNSCSQYAMLGLKAASLLGATIKLKQIEHEAQRLVDQYFEVKNLPPVEWHTVEESERSTDTEWKGKIRPGGWSYTCGTPGHPSLQMTAAGISSLVICMDELKVRGKLDKKLARKLGLTIHGAQTWMADNYYEPGDDTTKGLDYHMQSNRGDGWGIFYNLYSVERGCVLANIKKLGDKVDWYEIGASALIEHQHADGRWYSVRQVPGRQKTEDHHQTINTCMAILFLKMAALPVFTDHERRAKGEDKDTEPRSPITPGPEDKKKKNDE